LIERYQTNEMRQIFSDVRRMQIWTDVELAVVEGFVHNGDASAADLDVIRANLPLIDQGFVDDVLARERVTNHDLAAFVDTLQSRIAVKESSWIHFGLTSSDVVDTAFSIQIREALEVIVRELRKTILATISLAERHKNTPEIGRTHGMHAEPTTFGGKVVLWAYQLDRDLSRAEKALAQASVGKLSGAVGTYSNVDPVVEHFALSRLGLRPVPATQVVARDIHAEVMYSLAAISTSLESFATEIRHLQRSEVGEVFEPFAQGQKGSSAMPHKRNPIVAERIVGLARILRGFLSAALEDVALWHERDISHSSVERVIFPDAFHLCHYGLLKFRWLVENLEVKVEKMRENLDASLGLYFSQSVLLALVEAGLSRDEAYRIVQRDARAAYESKRSFIEILKEDPSVRVDLEEVLDESRLLRNVPKIFEGLGELKARLRDA
jgi:adenylosuccinate lyase